MKHFALVTLALLSALLSGCNLLTPPANCFGPITPDQIRAQAELTAKLMPQ